MTPRRVMRGIRKNQAAIREWRKQVECSLRAAGVLRTLADMTEEQIVALEKHYGCKVRRP